MEVYTKSFLQELAAAVEKAKSTPEFIMPLIMAGMSPLYLFFFFISIFINCFSCHQNDNLPIK